MIEEKFDKSKVKRWQGSYSFQIDGYSGLTSRVSDCIESPEFTLCGHKWQLRIFPGGSLEVHKDYVSFYLASKSNRTARASYRLVIPNQIFGLADEGFSSSAVRVFEAKGTQIDGWGRDKFIESSLLADPDYGFRVNDSVIFKVEMTVFGDLEILSSGLVELDDRMSNSSLEMSMQHLFEHPTHSDVTFLVGPQELSIPAHKCVLMARSPVFYAMFSHNMKEELVGEVRVPDVEFAVMKEVLHYLYTGQRLNEEVEQISLEELFYAAVKYQIPGLVSMCEQYFIAQVSVDTVVSLLSMADTFGAQGLKLKCMQFIAQNSTTVLLQQSFHELDAVLLEDVHRLIAVFTKRKGCGAGGAPVVAQVVERERRSCAIM